MFILVGCCLIAAPANAAESVISPDPIFAAMSRPINDLFFEIWIGNFEGGYIVTDVNHSAILINGNLTPANVEVATHPDFTGDALKISVLSTDFLPPYGTLWDTQNQDYSVYGEFNDATTFLAQSTFTSVGHISGDVNSDGRFNILDLTFLVDRFFRGGLEPPFLPTADVNGSCDELNLADLTFLVDRIFRSGPAPTHCPEQ